MLVSKNARDGTASLAHCSCCPAEEKGLGPDLFFRLQRSVGPRRRKSASVVEWWSKRVPVMVERWGERVPVMVECCGERVPVMVECWSERVPVMVEC